VAEALRDGTEDCLINGDTATSHGDTGLAAWNPRSRWNILGSSNDHRKAWIGWRQRAFDVDANVSTAATDQNATQTVAGYIAALSGLTVPHAFGDIVYITSPEHYLVKILTDTNVLTVDKYGPAATVLTGEVARIGGHPLILSEFVDKQYNTSGIYDDSTKTKTGLLIVNLAFIFFVVFFQDLGNLRLLIIILTMANLLTFIPAIISRSKKRGEISS
jgi:hypothetical protein